MKKIIQLFCGGSRDYANGKSKPLQIYGDARPLFVEHYFHIVDHFDVINYVCEVDEVTAFGDAIKKYKLDKAHIFEVSNHSTTLLKLREILPFLSGDYCSFSYPDIFCSALFWDVKSTKGVTLNKVPIKSRFPRIYSEMFSDKVKGVSDYQSKVPANPHFIYAGKFSASFSILTKEVAKTDEKNDWNLEVSLFDHLSLKEVVDSKTVYSDWFNIDSNRDFLKMKEIYG